MNFTNWDCWRSSETQKDIYIEFKDCQVELAKTGVLMKQIGIGKLS